MNAVHGVALKTAFYQSSPFSRQTLTIHVKDLAAWGSRLLPPPFEPGGGKLSFIPLHNFLRNNVRTI